MKTNLRARKMWANYYADGTCRIHSTKKNAWSWRCFTEDKASVPAAIPVAVIPLDDMDALISKATDAFLLEHCGPISCILEDRMRSALAAIGVLPRQRKGGAK